MTEKDNLLSQEDVTIIQTDKDAKDGQVKCPKCGSSDIQNNPKNGKLRCNFCRHEFAEERTEEAKDISKLTGMNIGSGAVKIEECEDIVTLKCESCGAEVVMDTSSGTLARCHWCRHTLSLNKQIPNGAVPDVILPFKLTKQEARSAIERFVGKRKFFAHPTFTKEFTTENIGAVYFPYMVVNANTHMALAGKAEIETGRHVVESGNKKETRYDADSYYVERDYDVLIDGLTIEASADKLDYNSCEKTTNIINAIMPFDTENFVKYNANYLKGCTSEKRDADIRQLQSATHAQLSDVARLAANESLTQYDRGVCWERENFEIKGESWKSSYLPVWLYSYMQQKGNKNFLHYVAVNARSGETMGSVPIHFTKLIVASIIVEFFGGFLAWFLGTEKVNFDSEYRWLLLLSGVAFYLVMYMRYRNAGARHNYETETKKEIRNMLKKDEFLKHYTNLTNSMIDGCNNTDLKGNVLNIRLDKNVAVAEALGADVEEATAAKEKLEEGDSR